MPNQCDGCNRGLPMRNGVHFDPKTGYAVQGCLAWRKLGEK